MERKLYPPRLLQRLANLFKPQLLGATISISDRPIRVEWTQRAQRELEQRSSPLVAELEVYFSCMVKMKIHFLDAPKNDNPTTPVCDKLLIYFRPVTSTECSLELGARLGRQPEIELHNKAVTGMVPKHVFIDFKDGKWMGVFGYEDCKKPRR